LQTCQGLPTAFREQQHFLLKVHSGGQLSHLAADGGGNVGTLSHTVITCCVSSQFWECTGKTCHHCLDRFSRHDSFQLLYHSHSHSHIAVHHPGRLRGLMLTLTSIVHQCQARRPRTWSPSPRPSHSEEDIRVTPNPIQTSSHCCFDWGNCHARDSSTSTSLHLLVTSDRPPYSYHQHYLRVDFVLL
jgi:hypothetical protein